MRKKNYFQPAMKLHELKFKTPIQASSNTPDIHQDSKSLPASTTTGDSGEDATQGFGTIDGWI